jgi:hypothetical protein
MALIGAVEAADAGSCWTAFASLINGSTLIRMKKRESTLKA